MTAPFASWSSVIHSCRASTVYFDDAVRHVVTVAHGPRATPLSDFEDAGFDAVAVGVLPSEIGGCNDADRFPTGRHILLRRSTRSTPSTGTLTPNYRNIEP